METYYPTYITLSNNEIVKTVTIEEYPNIINIDYDINDKVVGIEIIKLTDYRKTI